MRHPLNRGSRRIWLLAGPVLVVPLVLLFVLGSSFRGCFWPDNRYAKTQAIIQALDKACQTYKLNFGAFPPNDKGDSRSLHYHLGRPVMYRTCGLYYEGRQFARPPIIEFPADWLQLRNGEIPDPDHPVPIIDAWGHPIKYLKPGLFNPSGVDIWSSGRNGNDGLAPENPDFDGICNWVRSNDHAGPDSFQRNR